MLATGEPEAPAATPAADQPARDPAAVRLARSHVRPAAPPATTTDRPAPQPLPAPDLPADVVETRLAGIVFLLNVALALDLYPDFTRPADRGIAIDPWHLIADLARALDRETVEPDAPHEPDAIWAALDTLAGGPPRSSGVEPFEMGAWRMPPAWVAPFGSAAGDEPWSWSAAGGRLVVRHPAGFTVLDLPAARVTRRRVTRRRVTRVLRPYRPAGVVRRADAGRPPAGARRSANRPWGSPAYRRWLARLAEYTRVRLAEALGRPPAVAPAIVLRLDGRLLITATTVDVELRLADLPIEIRLAGLDRDPGWIPAARRVVRFQFR